MYAFVNLFVLLLVFCQDSDKISYYEIDSVISLHFIFNNIIHSHLLWYDQGIICIVLNKNFKQVMIDDVYIYWDIIVDEFKQ